MVCNARYGRDCSLNIRHPDEPCTAGSDRSVGTVLSSVCPVIRGPLNS